MANHLPTSKGALSLLCVILIASLPFAAKRITTPERGWSVRNDSPEMKTAVTQSSDTGKLLAGMPLRFEPNRGQTDSHVKFLARGEGYSLFLTETEAVLKLTRSTLDKAKFEHIETGAEREDGLPQSTVVRMKLLSAQHPTRVEPLDEMSGQSSYFIGSNASFWRMNIPGYARVVYRGVYPGVDLIYYGNQGRLEYDFRLAPHVDPKTISLSFEGVEGLRVDADNNLLINVLGGELQQPKPAIYQEADGVRRVVGGRYVLGENNRVGFEVDDYDRDLPLLIDPIVSYSTYLGGSGSERPSTVAVDSSGNAYVTGDSSGSTDFPVTAGAYKKRNSGGDAYVTKIAPPSPSNPNATLIYSTYLGGRFNDRALDIAVDPAGNAYVSGWTESSDFPVTSGAFQTKIANPKQGGGTTDAFVTKLTSSGSALLYSSYLGGAGDDYGDAIAVSSGGYAFVAGETNSTTKFPTKAGFQTSNRGGTDAFIAKVDTSVSNLVNAPASLVFSSFLGGGGTDRARDVTADSTGHAYLTGETSSPNFPTANPYQATLAQGSSAFVSQVASPSTSSTVSSLTYSTYLSGTASSWGGGIAIREVSGQLEGIYVVGTTLATDFPLVNPYQTGMMGGSDVFVTKFDPFGTSLVYSTYIGGNHFDDGVGIAIDSAGNAYVTGDTKSYDFPIVDAFQPTFVGGSSCGGQPPLCADAFLLKLTSDGGTVVYSSFLGGNGWDSGIGVGVDSGGCATVTGWTYSTNFQPIMNQLLPNGGVLRGTSDAFVTRLCPSP